MKATILHISAKGNSALIAIDTPVEGTPIRNKVNGWVPCASTAKKEDTFELPFTTVHQSTSTVTDEDTGEVSTFTWLSFS